MSQLQELDSFDVGILGVFAVPFVAIVCWGDVCVGVL